MPDISRRRLLQGAGTAAAAAFAAEFLPSNVRKALAAGPSRGGSIRDIKHVVILMQENRSFDHYFGTLPNVRGFSDPNAITLSSGQKVWYQPDTSNPDGYLLPLHIDTTATSGQSIPSTSHAWNIQHDSWDGGLMDGFVSSHIAANGVTDGQYTMSYLDRNDIPFHYALAENFTICDGYHCSLLGPTWPNRLYLMSAWIDPAGVQGGPIISNQHSTPYGWKSYPEALTEAGVSWKVYQEVDNYGCNVLEYFDSFQTAPVSSPLYQNGLRSYQDGQFEWDALHDRLPTVSWLIPTSYQSEHPDYTPAAGADFVASKINAIAANPDVWNSTVFILNYDENDGLFDHVAPPTAPPGTPGEYLTIAARVGLRRLPAHRRRVPGAVPDHLAVDDGRLDRQRDLRPHLHAAVPRAADRRDDPEHHPVAAADLRRPVVGLRRVHPGLRVAPAAGHQGGAGQGRLRGQQPARPGGPDHQPGAAGPDHRPHPRPRPAQ